MMKSIVMCFLVTYGCCAPNNSETTRYHEVSGTREGKQFNPIGPIRKLNSKSPFEELKPLHHTHSKNLNKKLGKHLLGVDALLGRSLPSLLNGLPKTKMDISVGCGNNCEDRVDTSSSFGDYISKSDSSNNFKKEITSRSFENDAMDENLTGKQHDNKESFLGFDLELSKESKSLPVNVFGSSSNLEGRLGENIEPDHAVPYFVKFQDNINGSETAIENTKNSNSVDNEKDVGNSSEGRNMDLKEDFEYSVEKRNQKSVQNQQEENEINETKNDIISYSRSTNGLCITEDDESMGSPRSTDTEMNSNTLSRSQYSIKEKSLTKTYNQRMLKGIGPFVHRFHPDHLSSTKMLSRTSVKKTLPPLPSAKLQRVPLFNRFPQSIAGSDLYGSYAYANTGVYPNGGFGGTMGLGIGRPGGGEQVGEVIEETGQVISESQEEVIEG